MYFMNFMNLLLFSHFFFFNKNIRTNIGLLLKNPRSDPEKFGS